jgi:peptidoglycan/LPS O-acetylase OafA/YrhL
LAKQVISFALFDANTVNQVLIQFSFLRAIALSPPWLSGLPIFYWCSWALGVLVAEAYVMRQPLPFANTSLLVWFALFVLSYLFIPLSMFGFLFVSVFTAALIAKLLQGSRWIERLPKFLAEHLRLTGVWSYSVYLIHLPGLWAVMYLSGWLAWPPLAHPLVRFALGLTAWALILPLSGLCYRYLEAPSIALGKRPRTSAASAR